MITMRELNRRGFATTPEIDANLVELLRRINLVRLAYAKPMVVTSGLRSREHQIKVYAAKGVPADKVPLKSKHLTGQAVDIRDEGQLYRFLQDNPDVLERAGLWCYRGKGFIHFQSVPPKSGRRWFGA